MDKKKLLPKKSNAQYGNQPPPPRPDPVKCDQRPECEHCTMPGHGFVCHFSGDECLRYPKGKPQQTEES